MGQVAKPNPHITSGRTGEVFPSNLLALLREVRIITVGVECLRIGPLNLGSLWIDLESGCFAPGFHFLRGPRHRLGALSRRSWNFSLAFWRSFGVCLVKTVGCHGSAPFRLMRSALPEWSPCPREGNCYFLTLISS